MAKGRLLAIDDKPFYQRFYKNLFEDEGYYVFVADSVEAGLDALNRDNFDLVIADLALGGLKGLELVVAIQQFAPQQEILIITGHQDVTLAVQTVEVIKHVPSVTTGTTPCLGPAAVSLLQPGSNPGINPPTGALAAEGAGALAASDRDVAYWIAEANRHYDICAARLNALVDFEMRE